jgi:two-component system sensor histidine kinase CreC
LDNLRVRYLEGVEDPLVDQAIILATMLSRQMEVKQFDPEKLYETFDRVYSRSLSVKVYDLAKTHVDMRVYITDATGKVIFDSQSKQNIGADYSSWRDVHLTLRGQYGARTTRKDTNDPLTSVLYVAAPIKIKDKIAGVLTVAKPTTNINAFLKNARPKVFGMGAVAVMAAVLLSYIVSLWLTLPIKNLTEYANSIRQGKRVSFPKLDRSEIGEMGHAFQKMQGALEGKRYVEQYVENLTHEVKSPLSAIRGAAELLEEEMRPEQRHRFLSNIRSEANRIQEIVDRMLELSALESRNTLQKTEIVSIHSLVNTVVESKQPMVSKKNLRLRVHIQEDASVRGDSFLLFQAISNLLQNAIDFSPDCGEIELTSERQDKRLIIVVADHGSGIPGYATERVFHKFFSLRRPDSGKKSTGLGLNFVKEVAELHNGEVKVENQPDQGVRALLTLPL